MKKIIHFYEDIYIEVDFTKYKNEVLKATKNKIDEIINGSYYDDDDSCFCFWKLANNIYANEYFKFEKFVRDNYGSVSLQFVDDFVDELYEGLQEYAKQLIFGKGK